MISMRRQTSAILNTIAVLCARGPWPMFVSRLMQVIAGLFRGEKCVRDFSCQRFRIFGTFSGPVATGPFIT